MPARHLPAGKIVLVSVLSSSKTNELFKDHYSTAYRLLTNIITISILSTIYTLIKKQYKLPFMS